MLILLRKAQGVCPHCGQNNAGGACRCASRGDWSPPKSQAQAEAGNYKKPTLTWRGLTIKVENPAGTVRRGPGWAILMEYDYGYVAGTEAVDGDEVDVYLGPALAFAPMVYVVHQRKRGLDEAEVWREYDEDKCMLGFLSEHQARAAYLEHYTDPRFLGPITAMPVDQFVEKAKATRGKPAMIKALFLKARDRRDVDTPDLFGTHLEQHVRKDGVVQGYHVAHPSTTVHDSKTQSAAPPASETAKPHVSNLSNNAAVNPKGSAVDEKLNEAPAAKTETDGVKRRRVKVELEGTHTELTFPDGRVHRIQRLNSGESMGVPGWHDFDAQGINSYLAETEEEAIKVLLARKAPEAEWKRPNKRDVPDWLVGAVEAKVEKVNRRAKKLGIEGFRLMRGEEFKKVVSGIDEWPIRYQTYVPLTIEGPVIKVPGWSLQGRVDFEDDSILVNARPGAELPPRYRSIKPVCDHCNSNRQRNAVFVFQSSDDDGKYMQVGRQCLQDFMGKSPEAVLWAASEFGGIFDDIDEELGRSGGGGNESVKLLDVMAAAALAVRLHGFRSRKAADENGGVPTSSDVFDILFPPKNPPKGTPPTPKPEEADNEKAQTVIDWVQNTWGAKSDQSDYEYNAVELTGREAVRPKRIGILTSLIAAYDRAMEVKVERAKRVNAHVGEVGERREFVATYAGENWFDTAFGAMTIARFDTPEGLLVYKGGTPFWSDTIKAGDQVRFKATIKQHGDYKGAKQTLISRCVLLKDDEPAKPAKAPKKKKAPEPEPAF